MILNIPNQLAGEIRIVARMQSDYSKWPQETINILIAVHIQ